MNAKILQNIHINMILRINKLKNKKKHTIISIDAGKTSDKIQHPFTIKTFQKVGTEGTDINMMKAMYDKPQQTSFSMVKTKSISSMIRNKTRMSAFTIFIQHSFRSPSRGNQRKRKKGSTNWKRRSKTVTVRKFHRTIQRKP